MSSSGRNWLWHNKTIPFATDRAGMNYGRELDSGGWDDILFSITAGELALPNGQVYLIPDHGDVVGRHWSVDRLEAAANGDAICDMSVNGREINYLFTRQLRLPDSGEFLEIRYSLQNREDFALPFYWCAHALISVSPDLQVLLPDKTPFCIDGFSENTASDSPTPQHWPNYAAAGEDVLDLSRSFSVSAVQNFAGKFFARSPAAGKVALGHANSTAKLIMQYSPDELPWLGLWINNDGWSGNDSAAYQNLGLEPTTTPYDCVTEAIANNSLQWIPPGEERNWQIAVGVQP